MIVVIKAMILSQDNDENISREKQDEIALQWDNIEKELHNESMVKHKYRL